MVLSKKLRVFFLSVLVVMFAVSSVMAATLTQLDWGSDDNAKAKYEYQESTEDGTEGTGKLTIKDKGYIIVPNYWSDNEVRLDEIILEADATEVELRLPDPYNNVPTEGIHGKWKITFKATEKKKQQLTIGKYGDANAAIILAGDWEVGKGDEETTEQNYWHVTEYATLIINAPIRANNEDSPFSLKVEVDNHAEFIFDSNTNVYGNGSHNATGFVMDGTKVKKRSLFEIADGGKLTVRNHTALQGALDVHVIGTDEEEDDKEDVTDGILVVDMEGATHRLEGAVLAIDGYIQVDKNLTITDGDNKAGGIIVTDKENKIFKKTGSATLTIGAGILNQSNMKEFAKQLFEDDDNADTDIGEAQVLYGTLYLNGTATYDKNGKRTAAASMLNADVKFTVSNDATLQLAKMSVQQMHPHGDTKGKVVFNVISGNLVMADHSVYALNALNSAENPDYREIYPYEDYITKDNSMVIQIGDGEKNEDVGVELDVKKAGKVTINGIQAFTKVTGAGTITVNGEGDDKGVIIFVGRMTPDKEDDEGDKVVPAHFNNFKGTINGTNANVGLWSGHFEEGLFKDATINADNLILYGYRGNNTVLDITEKNHAKLQSGFNHIYLRSNRPGADNSDPNIKTTMLTIGKIRFTGLNRVGGTDGNGKVIDEFDADDDNNMDNVIEVYRENSYVYTIKSLKVDATHVAQNAGTVDTDGKYRIVDIKSVQLYANRDLDFGGSFRPFTTADLSSHARGMYAIRLGTGYPDEDDDDNKNPYMSTILWNADGVTGDGDEADKNAVFGVQVLEKANVIVYGQGTENYSFGKNNSVIVKQDGKLELPSGAKISGNLTLESSTKKDGVQAWFEDDDQPMEVGKVVVDGAEVKVPNMNYPREEYFVPYHVIDTDNDGEKINGANFNENRTPDAFSQVWWDNDKLSDFTVLTTRLTKANRIDNNGGTYAVTVEGTLALSGDTDLTKPNTAEAIYPGKVMVRVKPDLDILDASDETVGTLTNGGQRFKVVGKEGGTKTNDFVPVYNAIYGFRISRERSNSENTGGVVFELRRNVGQLTLKNWEFTEDGYGDEFGKENSHNFKIRIYYDQKGTIPFGNGEYDTLVTYFGDYRDGVEHTIPQENVLDEGTIWYAQGDSLEDETPGRVYSSGDITFTAHLWRGETFKTALRDATTEAKKEAVRAAWRAAGRPLNDDGDVIDRNNVKHAGYIELVGISFMDVVRLPKIAIARNNILPYENYNLVAAKEATAQLNNNDDNDDNDDADVRQPIIIKSVPYVPASPALYSSYVVPSYKQYIFARDGVIPPAEEAMDLSNVTPYAEGSTNVVEGESANIKFVVPGMWKAPNAVTAEAVLTENGYIWNVGATNEDMFYMKDSNGRDVRVNNLVLRVYNGIAALATESEYTDYPATAEDGTENFTVELTNAGAVITAPSSVLGTATQFSTTKQVSLIGTRADGTGQIYTNPLTYTLLASSTEEPTHVEDLDLTITIGDEAGAEAQYGIDYDDLGVTNGNNIHLIAYDLPDWITFEGHGDVIAYKVTGTPPAAGTYTYHVLAYVGDDASTANKSKMYTFTVTVNAPAEPTLSVASLTVEAGKTGTLTLTVSGGDADTLRTFAITPLGTAPTNIFDKVSGINILGNSTATLTVTAGQTLATYNYLVSGNGLSEQFTVTIREPDPASVTINDPAEAGDYEDQFGGTVIDGYTYHAVFDATAENFEGDVPEIEFSFTKTDSTNSELYTFTSKDVETGAKLFIVEGVAKRNVVNEEDVTQSFTINANAGDVKAEEAVEKEFTVDADDSGATYPNTTGIIFTGESDAVTTGYRAMLPARTTATPDNVNLPLWLKPVTDPDDEDIVTGVEFVGYPLGDLENGVKATVRIYAEYEPAEDEELAEDDDGTRYYGWDVTYAAKPKAISLTLSASTLSLDVGGTGTVTATAADAQGDVTYTLSPDVEWAKMDNGTISVTAPTTAGTYTVTVIAKDANGGEATETLTITVAESAFSITANPTSVTFASPTAAAQTVTLSSTYTGTVTYTASVSPTTGLTAAVSGSQLTLTPSEKGTYTVTVTGDNGTETTTTTVNVTVNDSGSGGGDTDSFTITANPTSVTFASPTAAAQTVTLSSTSTSAVTYTASVNPSAGLTATVSGNVLTLTPSAAGTYTVTVTGNNGNGTETATINVTVNPGDNTGSFTITANPTTVTFTSSTAAAQTVTLSSTSTSTVTYTASVNRSTGLTATVSGNVLTLTPSAAGTYTVTITGDNGNGTATATVSVTVRGGSVGSSGGGCDAGFGALALVLAAPLFLRRRRS